MYIESSSATLNSVEVCGGTLIQFNWVLTAGHCLGKKMGSGIIIFDTIDITAGATDYKNGNGKITKQVQFQLY